MATFESSLKPRLIYVFAINDEWHKDCLKIGETTLDEGDGDLLAPNSEQLNKAARKRIDQYTKTAGIAYNLLYTELTLYIKGVAVCSFKKSASKKYDWEIARYCEDTFIYSADRLILILNRFVEENNPTSVVIYVDQSKYSGKELDKAGFKYVETLYPQRMWSKGIQKVLHNTIAGRTYDEVFHTNRNSKHSTYTQMIENGWLPVYDCGKKVYVR